MTRTRHRRTWITPVVAGVILLVAVLLALATTGSDPDPTPGGESAVAGDPLPTFDRTASSDLAVGQQVPSIIGFDFDGVMNNPTRNGRAKLFVFLAHWCTHCQRELPELVGWLNAGGADNVQVIAVVTLTDALRPNHPPRPWLEAAGWPGQIVVDNTANEIAQAYGLAETPFFVGTDAEDVVVARAAGELTPAELDALIAATG